jgi:hypothetical protein
MVVFLLKHSDPLKQKKTHETHKTPNIQQLNIYSLWSMEVWKLRCKKVTIYRRTFEAISILQFLQGIRTFVHIF